MQFNSLAYAIFLPIVFILYWLVPHKYRWVLLLVASYYFYMSWNPKYVVLILFTTFVSYMAARLVDKANSQATKKLILITALVLCLGVLFVFKYYNFAIESLASLFSLFAIPMSNVTLKLILPVGISFYTFQTLSYVIDVYRGDIKAEKNFGVYATFVSFFPQLVAGPIEKATNLLPQITSEKEFDYDEAVYGLRQMLWGFFKKILVADTFARYVDKVYSNVYGYKGVDLAFAIVFFTIQIYCDFSGYSDIAIGTAKLLGIKLMTNFKSPYFSTSIKEFWGRWHISLSQWFKNYVYIPLGGNRCSKPRHYINLLVTFLASGLWHGANWTFVVWGGMHGLVQVIEDIFKKPLNILKGNKVTKVLLGIVVFAICNVGWVFFRADTFADAFYVLRNCTYGITKPMEYYHNTIGLNHMQYLGIFITTLMVGIYDFASLKVDVIEWFSKRPLVLRLIVQYALIIWILWISIDNMGSNAFVYFQF